MSTTPSFRQRATRALVHGGRAHGVGLNVLYAIGALLLLESGYVHYHLWDTGYRHIPTIGPMFVLQALTAVLLAIALIIVRRAWLALACALFLLSTVGGFLLSVTTGLFKFKDSWQAPYAGLAFAVEVIGALVLLAGAALSLRTRESRR